jgi:hypothetical protein
LIERFFNKIKQCRRIATRYDKLAANYLAFIKLASIRVWLRANESTPWTDLSRGSDRYSVASCAAVGSRSLRAFRNCQGEAAGHGNALMAGTAVLNRKRVGRPLRLES